MSGIFSRMTDGLFRRLGNKIIANSDIFQAKNVDFGNGQIKTSEYKEWVISKITDLDLSVVASYPTCAKWGPDGSKLYYTTAGLGDATVYQLNATENFNLDTVNTTPEKSAVFESTIHSHYDIYISNDKSLFFIKSGGEIYEFLLDNGDIETFGLSNTYDFTAQTNEIGGMEFSDDESRFFIIDNSGYIYQYSLSTPGDLSTANYEGSVAAEANDPATRNLCFLANEQWLLVGDDNYDVFIYPVDDITNLNLPESNGIKILTLDNLSTLDVNNDNTKIFAHLGTDGPIESYSSNYQTFFDLQTEGIKYPSGFVFPKDIIAKIEGASNVTTVGTNSTEEIVLSNVVWDINGHVKSSNNTIATENQGKYLVTGNIYCQNFTSGTEVYVELYDKVGGSYVIQREFVLEGGSKTLSICDVLDLFYNLDLTLRIHNWDDNNNFEVQDGLSNLSITRIY